MANCPPESPANPLQLISRPRPPSSAWAIGRRGNLLTTAAVDSGHVTLCILEVIQGRAKLLGALAETLGPDSSRSVLSATFRRNTRWPRWARAQLKLSVQHDGRVAMAIEVWPGKRYRDILEFDDDGRVKGNAT